eukprot:TRINITY_DN2869_c0_g2_i1.p1 TRINITY_DN2869_c0_g2~~TRINITY_DN2869_c0_g2_i1.p1  ORF type:complete len:481 (-),score=110.86 TRINITY_DN2869_c0_g2_i1:101-1519(-)
MDPLGAPRLSTGGNDPLNTPSISTLEETQFFEPNASASTMSSFNGSVTSASEAPRLPAMTRSNSNTSGRTSGGISATTGPSTDATLEISVTDPVKQGDGVQAYVSYRVSTKTNMPQYRFSTSSVIRRFSDFGWLHDRLAEKNKGIIIPPLPEKNVVEKFLLHNEFIDARRQALSIFANRVAAHPQLRFSSDLQLFLEASEEVWAMETARASEGSILKTDNFFQMFKDVQTKVTTAVLGKEKPAVEHDEEYDNLKAYVLELEGHLAECRRQAERLVKRQREVRDPLKNFGAAMADLGGCEGRYLGRALGELKRHSEDLSIQADKQAHKLMMNFEQSLREYVRMVHSIKNVMTDRELTFQEHQQLTLDIESKKAKLVKLRTSQPPAKHDKIDEVENEIQELNKKVQLAKEKHDEIIECMRSEMVRFQKEKAHDLGVVLRDFAISQAELAAETAREWRTLLPQIEAAKNNALKAL